MCYPTQFECLSSQYWCLLGSLTSDGAAVGWFTLGDMEVMRSLEGGENWEKLEVGRWPCDDRQLEGMCGWARVELSRSEPRLSNAHPFGGVTS